MGPRVLAASCGALLLIGLATGPAGATTAPAADYVEALCTSLGDLSSTVTEGQRDVQAALDESSSLSDIKQTFVSFLEDSIAAGKQAVAELKAAGSPDVDHGAPIAATIRKAFAGVTRTFAEVRDDAEELPTSGARKFRRGVEAIGARLDRASKRFSAGIEAAEKRYGDVAELDEAYAAEPACSAAS